MSENHVAKCLRGEIHPPLHGCPPSWRNQHCLRSDVPAWGASYSLVQQCFHCCLTDALRRTGLDRNRPFWHKRLMLEARDPWDRTIPTLHLGVKHGVGSSVDPYHEESLDNSAVLLNRYALHIFAHLGSEYARGVFLTVPEVNKSASARRRFTLVAIDGWVGRQDAPALRRLEKMLPSLPQPVVVYVRGDDFLPVPNAVFDPILRSPFVDSWWSDNPHIGSGQNAYECQLRNPSLTVDGKDLCVGPPTDHSAFEHKIHGWPRGLSNSLLWHRLLSQDNYSAAQLVRDRPNLLFCGCFTTHTLGNSGRVQKAKSLEKNGFRCTAHCKRGEGNEAAFQYKFVVSMRGNSAQNYRDWEALLAGAIPLVDYNAAHEPMWEGMPVVQIRNWADVTVPFLETTWAKMRDRPYSWKKLYFPFWLDHLLSTIDKPAERAPAPAPPSAADSHIIIAGGTPG